ncbi:TCR/Tet family MFS transporter [Reichenbachiella sp. MALMAid0571]|uniref:TCR/Tet family MFS transporter n=1 Tax=Reichenbachiella sp. MALMAid0571 TaxID=3143939 RepID=UPI0032DF2635
MSQKPKAALGFIFITLVIDVIGFGIIIPVVPDLIMELIDGEVSDASVYGGFLTFSYAIMQFICSPILGGLSDRYGRRPVLLISLFGFAIDYLLVAWAPTIAWLFLARIISGISGASMTTASAYIADISKPEKRAQNFGLIGAAFGIGFIIGPVIGGFLGEYGTRVPFLAAAGLTLLNCIYGYFILPESLDAEHRRPFSWKRANPLGSLFQLKKYPIIIGLIGALFFVHFAAHSTQSIWTFYTKLKFAWDPKMIGLSLGFVGLMVGLVQGVLIRRIIPIIGEQKGIYYGLSLYLIGFILFAFATDSWMMFVFSIPYAFSGLSGPSMQSIMTKQVSPNAQGELQGAITSVISLTAAIAPPVMTGLFYQFTQENAQVFFPGAPFLLGALLSVVSISLAHRSLTRHHF